MKILVAGVSRINGKAKATGNPYDMARIHVLVPAENTSRENFIAQGAGYIPNEMDAQTDIVTKSASLKFPGMYEVKTDTVFRAGRAQTIVTELVPA